MVCRIAQLPRDIRQGDPFRQVGEHVLAHLVCEQFLPGLLHGRALLPAALGAQPVHGAQQRGEQLVVLNGLEQVPHRAQGQRLPGIFKIVVPADKQDFRVGVLLLDDARQVNAAQLRHVHVGDQDVHGHILNHLQGVNPALRRMNLHRRQQQPRNLVPQALQIQPFVIHNKDVQHHSLSSPIPLSPEELAYCQL